VTAPKIPADVRAWLLSEPSALDRVRGLMRTANPPDRVLGAESAARHLRRIAYGPTERFAVLVMDRAGHVLACEEVSNGGAHFALVCCVTILRRVLAHPRAAAVIVAHNHPSDGVTPSTEDQKITEVLHRGFAAVGLTMLDHLILTDPGGYYSFAEAGTLPSRSASPHNYVT
jgi:DNA repair protein RadC